MNVIFVRGHYDTSRDAASRALAQLIGALSAYDIDVRLISYVEMGLDGSRLPATLRRAFYMARATWTLVRLPQRAVVVTLEEPTGVGLVVRTANVVRRFMGMPAHGHVSWLMDLFTLQRVNLSREGKTASRRLDRLRLLLDRAALAKVDRIVVLGECMWSVANSVFGCGRTTVLPIWQVGDELRDGTGAELRKAWGISAERTLVLYSGHLNYRHPVEAILQAAERTVADGVDFVFVGDGARFDDLASSDEVLRRPNVQFRPKPSATPIRDVLAAGDIHVVALEEEATGTCVPSKTYAAMAAQRPVLYVGSARGQAAIDVLAAQAGYVVAPEDVDALTANVRRLHSDLKLREESGRLGSEYFSRERDLPIVSARWRTLIAEVGGTNRHRGELGSD